MAYYFRHKAINSGSVLWGQSDILYRYLNILIPNYYVFIAIISLFYMVTIHWLIKNNVKKEQYWFALLLLLINPYLFLIHLSSLRQTLALCLFVFAVNSAIKRKTMMYVLFSLLAVGMHSSAVILLPLYFIFTTKKLNKRVVFISYVSLVALLTTPLFDIIAYKTLEYMPAHYTYIYFEDPVQNSLRSVFISSFFFFLVSFNVHRLEGKEVVYGKLSLIGTMLPLLASKVAMISRINMYFSLFLIVTIPHIFSNIEHKVYRQILFISMITIYILRYYSFFTTPLWESFVRYGTILGK